MRVGLVLAFGVACHGVRALYMGEKPGTTSTNSTEILRQYLSQKVCNASTTYCPGSSQRYASHESCMSFLAGEATGLWYRMGEDNLLCRHSHDGMLPLRPAVHRPHIDPSGDGMCIDRDCLGTVTTSRFPAGSLAPKIVTPENEAEVGDIAATDGMELDPLLGIAMSRANMYSWDPSMYATALLGYLLAFYICSKILSHTLYQRSTVFRALSLEHQRNVVTYALHTIYTTVALGLQLASTPAIAGSFSLRGLQYLRTAGVLISALYCFELIYRIQMRVPMILHHFLTIFAISWTVAVFEYTSSTTYVVSAIIWLFQATTEQLTCIALLGYRLGWSRSIVSPLLKVAAVQSFVVKSASAISLLVYWGLYQNYNYRPIDLAWSIILFLCGIALTITQMWGSYVTFSITRLKFGGLEVRLEDNLDRLDDLDTPDSLGDVGDSEGKGKYEYSLCDSRKPTPPSKRPSMSLLQSPTSLPTTPMITADEAKEDDTLPSATESAQSMMYLRRMDSPQRSISPCAIPLPDSPADVEIDWTHREPSGWSH